MQFDMNVPNIGNISALQIIAQINFRVIGKHPKN